MGAPDPVAVAWFGMVIVWTYPPILAALLAFMPMRHGRGLALGLAVLLLALWVPLVIAGPDIARQLIAQA